MEGFSMYVTRQGSSVQIRIHIPNVNEKESYFPFSFNCSEEWAAKLLESSLRKAIDSTVQEIRESEYNAGLKDARGKKENRRTWFHPAFKVFR